MSPLNVGAVEYDCSNASCFCTPDGSDCQLSRNGSGQYTVLSDITNCGCAPTRLEPIDGLNFCGRTSAIWQFVGYGLFALKILIPLIIIILGIIDFAKAVGSNKDEEMRTAAMSILKRVILGIVIFFIPTIISVLFDLLENFTGSVDAISACETCLLNPTSETCEEYISDAECARNPSACSGTVNTEG